MRAVTGRVPGHDELQRQAAALTATTLAWPAPANPATAVDDLEHDLAVLKPLLQASDTLAVKGRAHYLLTLNDRLHRSLTERWKRWRGAWTDADGIVRVVDGTREPLTSQRLTTRPYSLSALQRYAACPYQFLLGAIYRIEPFEVPEPLQRLDPLTKGALFHRIQAEFYRALKRLDLLPVRPSTLSRALGVLDETVDRVSEEEREKLVPAIDRVWRDEVARLRRDLRRWVELMPVGDQEDWIPERFEFSFGLRDEGRDPSSVQNPVLIADRFLLRGAVDLIERHGSVRTLRVTDHKTGKCRASANLQIGGGAILQPVLYSLAVERALGERVIQGRLYFCTSDGGYREQVVELFDVARRHGVQALEIIDRAIELGFLAAVPAEGACRYCDFRPVCGPAEERRTERKNSRDKLLADLLALRELP
jgi:ATP-dependent helicase/nuclease subunit B